MTLPHSPHKKLSILNSDNMELDSVVRMEKRLQMLIALILFTPTILASLGSDSFQSNKTTLTWGIIVAIYIGIYILLEASKGKINRLQGHIIDWSIWINLTAFIPFLICIGMYQDVISGPPLYVFLIALLVVFGLPQLLILILALIFMLRKFFSLVKTLKN